MFSLPTNAWLENDQSTSSRNKYTGSTKRLYRLWCTRSRRPHLKCREVINARSLRADEAPIPSPLIAKPTHVRIRDDAPQPRKIQFIGA